MSGKDHRNRTRVKFKTEVILISSAKTLSSLSSRDLSLKGLYVETEETFPLGTEVDIKLSLSGSTSELILNMSGKVTRVEKKGMAVGFSTINEDSFYHLRKIIQYNNGDPVKVDRELSQKPGFDI